LKTFQSSSDKKESQSSILIAELLISGTISVPE